MSVPQCTSFDSYSISSPSECLYQMWAAEQTNYQCQNIEDAVITISLACTHWTNKPSFSRTQVGRTLMTKVNIYCSWVFSKLRSPHAIPVMCNWEEATNFESTKLCKLRWEKTRLVCVFSAGRKLSPNEGLCATNGSNIPTRLLCIDCLYNSPVIVQMIHCVDASLFGNYGKTWTMADTRGFKPADNDKKMRNEAKRCVWNWRRFLHFLSPSDLVSCHSPWADTSC